MKFIKRSCASTSIRCIGQGKELNLLSQLNKNQEITGQIYGINYLHFLGSEYSSHKLEIKINTISKYHKTNLFLGQSNYLTCLCFKKVLIMSTQFPDKLSMLLDGIRQLKCFYHTQSDIGRPIEILSVPV